MTIKSEIETALKILDPTTLIVTDESHKHKGHAQAGNAIETHFHVEITASQFIGKSGVARHKIVYKALGNTMKKIHALALKTNTP